ncbi:MAG: hypothetical protein JWM25_345 [Thermoleophilia bacterium]|nr:hypothetical protein [Thermoleophilia bacterium]
MHLSPIHPNRTITVSPTDAMSPRALFAAASSQFADAIGVLNGNALYAPSAAQATQAIGRVESGVNTLRSVLSSDTPFPTKQRAAGAMDRARDGVSQLLEYAEATHLRFGTLPVSRARISDQQVRTLNSAIELLLSATGRLAWN